MDETDCLAGNAAVIAADAMLVAGASQAPELRCVEDEGGQSTVEYLLVLAAFLSMMLAIGALWQVARSGRLVELAAEASSHGGQQGLSDQLKDIVMF